MNMLWHHNLVCSNGHIYLFIWYGMWLYLYALIYQGWNQYCWLKIWLPLSEIKCMSSINLVHSLHSSCIRNNTETKVLRTDVTVNLLKFAKPSTNVHLISGNWWYFCYQLKSSNSGWQGKWQKGSSVDGLISWFIYCHTSVMKSFCSFA